MLVSQKRVLHERPFIISCFFITRCCKCHLILSCLYNQPPSSTSFHLFTMAIDEEITLPLIDLSGYINPQKPGDKERVIAEVRDACAQFGFFQTTGHGIPLSSQQDLLTSIDTLFALPKEDKRELSFLKNVCRRGYEESGMTLREGDALPDSKEVKYPD